MLICKWVAISRMMQHDEYAHKMSYPIPKHMSCRARLEQVEQRMMRNITAVEAEHNRASPRTVEKVLMSSADMASDATAEIALAEVGANLTRKRLAKDLMMALQ